MVHQCLKAFNFQEIVKITQSGGHDKKEDCGNGDDEDFCPLKGSEEGMPKEKYIAGKRDSCGYEKDILGIKGKVGDIPDDGEKNDENEQDGKGPPDGLELPKFLLMRGWGGHDCMSGVVYLVGCLSGAKISFRPRTLAYT
jgi:hypothetical protein